MPQNPNQYGSTKIPGVNAGQFPNVTSEFDKARMRSYKLYEDLYFTNTEDYKVILRGHGEDDQNRPVYIPTAAKIVRAKLRFLGKGFSYTLRDPSDPKKELKEDALVQELNSLLEREAFDSKLRSQLRWKLVRGDAIWMISADEDAEDPKSSISIYEVDPASYFPIEDEERPGHILGCYIVDEIDLPGGKKGEKCARVQKYWYETEEDDETGFQKKVPNAPVKYSSALYEIGKWDERELEEKDIKKIKDLVPERVLHENITTIPIFIDRNNPPQNALFGCSELQGIESLVITKNQIFSDEELSLIMSGLGVYATSGGRPRDSAGNPTSWSIGPRVVIEHGKDDKFYRVDGISTVAPMHEHIKLADEEAMQTAGLADMAVGVVDASTAESGVALQLKMGPTIGDNQEKEGETKRVISRLLFCLIYEWLPAFGGVPAPSGEQKLKVDINFEDPMPKNVDKEFERLMALWEASLIPAKKICEQLSAILGFELTEEDFKQAVEDKKSIAVASDPFMMQMGGEMSDATEQQPMDAVAGEEEV